MRWELRFFCCGAVVFSQNRIDFVPHSLSRPTGQGIMHGGSGRVIFWQHPPLATGLVQVANGVEAGDYGILTGNTPPSTRGGFINKKPADQLPFLFSQISWVVGCHNLIL